MGADKSVYNSRVDTVPGLKEQGTSKHLVIAQSQQVAINNRPRLA